MVTGPQRRILHRLSSFSNSLESAWDVPRDLCLPGLAEFLGVVRSALHSPLKDLVSKGLILERKAHVINGGNRKRSVYHITDLGRAECEEVEIHVVDKKGRIFGNPPSKTTVYGRERLLKDLKLHNKLIITGLPGIGKTTILRSLAEKFSLDGKTVRYARMDQLKGIKEIFRDWELSLTSESAVLNETRNEILILDELQEINQRHMKGVESFVSKATNVIMAGRAPLPIIEGFEIIEIMPLENRFAVKLLPDNLENPDMVAERLGCHPLALQMYDTKSDLPEGGADLQKWVSDVVLSRLSDEMDALDELSLLPIPVPVGLLKHQMYVNDLDDFALLRWLDCGVELHHLLRNVRSAMLSKSDYEKAARYWSNVDGDLARLIEIHHLIQSEGEVESLIMKHSESLMANSSSGLASLLSNALFMSPSRELHRLAASIAIERGEIDVAKNHLMECDAQDLEYKLSILENNITVSIPSDADYKLLLSEVSRRLDDRLPEESIDADVEALLNKIDISKVDEETRKTILVSIAHIRHALFVSKGNWAEADRLSSDLELLTHAEDPQIIALKLRSKIAQTPTNTKSFEKLIESVFTKTGLRAKMLQIAVLLRCDDSRASKLLNRIDLPSIDAQNNLTSARRISANIWYLRAKLKTHNPISSMAEAVSLWKLSLCPEASKKASEMMHKML